MEIVFIQTGGTIDKDYPRGETDHGYTFEISEPAVASILPRMHVTFTYKIVEATKKDSLDLTDEDRSKIFEVVDAQECERIVITHGTDRMLQTAEILSSITDKTIVMAGAMLPEKFMQSDARFNVGMAVGAVQILPPGVYIALYGRVVPWKEFKQLSQEHEKRAREGSRA